MADKTYWAAKEGEEFLKELYKRIGHNKDFVQTSPYFRLLLKKRRLYYGQAGSATSFGMKLAGDRGQLVSIHANKFREVATHVLGLLTTDDLSYTAYPLNSDAKSQNQAIIATDFLTAATEINDLNKRRYESGERAFIDGEAFIHLYWDSFAGELLSQDPETGQSFYEGDIVCEVVGPDKIGRDLLAPPDKQFWKTVTVQVNKYDLAAHYPKYADQILSSKAEAKMFGLFGLNPAPFYNNQTSEDMIDLTTFYHEKTPSLPEGKWCLSVNDQTCLAEGPLEYKRIPLIRISAADIMDSAFGYTPANDALVYNEILNAARSIELSNALNHGSRTILTKAGNKFAPVSMSGGNKVLEYTTDPPIVMDYPSTPAEVVNLGLKAEQDIANCFGQNAVSMGQIESSTRLSYASMSMAENKAIQSIKSFSASFNRGWKEVGQLYIEIFKLKAKAPRMVKMVGESGAYLIKDFSSESLAAVDRVGIELGNALTALPNQRMNILEMLLQFGLITDPTDATEFLMNGKIDRPLMSKMMKAIRIKEHCEMLSRGEKPAVLATDDHVLFIQHVIANVLNKETAVQDPVVVQACMEYIDERTQLAMQTPPQLAALYGHTPIPIIAPPGEMSAPTDVPPEEAAPTEQPPAEPAPAEPVAA